MDESILSKFPSILKEKLNNGDIVFPKETEYIYDNIMAYRAVKREKNDYSDPTLDDFKSYFELGQIPKKAKGVNFSKDPHFYGVSFYENRKKVEQIMKFPNPHKKMMLGYIYCKGGPQHTTPENGHICWWLFQDVNISGFKITK